MSAERVSGRSRRQRDVREPGPRRHHAPDRRHLLAAENLLHALSAAAVGRLESALSERAQSRSAASSDYALAAGALRWRPARAVGAGWAGRSERSPLWIEIAGFLPVGFVSPFRQKCGPGRLSFVLPKMRSPQAGGLIRSGKD